MILKKNKKNRTKSSREWFHLSSKTSVTNTKLELYVDPSSCPTMPKSLFLSLWNIHTKHKENNDYLPVSVLRRENGGHLGDLLHVFLLEFHSVLLPNVALREKTTAITSIYDVTLHYSQTWLNMKMAATEKYEEFDLHQETSDTMHIQLILVSFHSICNAKTRGKSNMRG